MARVIECPGCEIEDEIQASGSVVCGMDEVGRGAWAGPLVIACVIPGAGTIDGVRDSKRIAPRVRSRLAQEIHSWAKGIGIGIVTNTEIDEWGMSVAMRNASLRALEALTTTSLKADVVLLDGHYDFIRERSYEVRTIVKGDNVSHAIAAASIVAKVHRDDYMASSQVAGIYPDFGFDRNKGYPAPIHRQALAQLGPTPLHRMSWDIFSHDASATQESLM